MSPSLQARKKSQNSGFRPLKLLQGRGERFHWPIKTEPTFFFIHKVHILTSYLEKGRTIARQYCADLLDQFNAELRKTTPQRTCSLLRNRHSKTGVIELRIAISPSVLPDLAPCDFLLFPNMKKWLDRKRFLSDVEIIPETDAYFVEFNKSYFLVGLKKLKYYWAKSIELKGDCIERYAFSCLHEYLFDPAALQPSSL